MSKATPQLEAIPDTSTQPKISQFIQRMHIQRPSRPQQPQLFPKKSEPPPFELLEEIKAEVPILNTCTADIRIMEERKGKAEDDMEQRKSPMLTRSKSKRAAGIRSMGGHTPNVQAIRQSTNAQKKRVLTPAIKAQDNRA